MAFRAALQRLGWTEEQNLQLDVGWVGADPQRMGTLAAETIRRAPDVIVTGSNLMTTIVGQQTRTIPIIFSGAGDPVGTGLVANMAHPGGNMTGFTTYESAIAGKKLELLKQVVPTLTRVAALYTPGGAGSLAQLRVTETAAPPLNLLTIAIGAQDGDAIRRLQLFRHLHSCSGCFRLGAVAGWVSHPLESAALSRRTGRADIRRPLVSVAPAARSPTPPRRPSKSGPDGGKSAKNSRRRGRPCLSHKV
jgi:hypothetical protein